MSYSSRGREFGMRSTGTPGAIIARAADMQARYGNGDSNRNAKRIYDAAHRMVSNYFDSTMRKATRTAQGLSNG